MKTGILFIRFDEKTTDNKIEDLISNFYKTNEKQVAGMEYQQYKSLEVLETLQKVVNAELEKRKNKK